MKYKIYENGTVLECLKRLLADGRRPATMEEAWKLREEKKIPMQWYDTGTVFFKGKIRKATMKELENIEESYKERGRVLLLYSYYGGLYGNNDLDSNGRFVGVKIKK